MQAIAANGYQILYLTSRPLPLADRTRRYLSKLGMPQAPVITSRDGAWRSLKRELSGCAHLFKSEALEGIAKVFRLGDHAFEFHSAFGNRSTDVKAYAAAGIEPSRTYVIDARGRVTCAGAAHAADSSYAAMLHQVNALFPPLPTQNHH
jgi:phosphatidate phosphatase LPIN